MKCGRLVEDQVKLGKVVEDRVKWGRDWMNVNLSGLIEVEWVK